MPLALNIGKEEPRLRGEPCLGGLIRAKLCSFSYGRRAVMGPIQHGARFTQAIMALTYFVTWSAINTCEPVADEMPSREGSIFGLLVYTRGSLVGISNPEDAVEAKLWLFRKIKPEKAVSAIIGLQLFTRLC